MLVVEDVHAYHGDSYTLQGVSLKVEAGSCVGILGRNGAGKTTLLHCLLGLHPIRRGRLSLDGTDLTDKPAHERVASGMGLVPQGRRIFPTLTVEENLKVVPSRGNTDINEAYRRFPRLAERRRNYGDQLSGGEQQMLAVARALMSDPSYLLLDEPTEGLAPAIIEDVGRVIAELLDEGHTLLLVEQNLSFALTHARDVYVLDQGKIVERGTAGDYRSSPGRLAGRLGIATA